MNSLWPYLQVKQPYLDCVTTIRVRLQEPFSPFEATVKRMIDHAEDFTRTGRNIWNAGHRRPYKYGYVPGSHLLYPCLPRRRKSLRGRQGLEPAKVRR
jgi:hypothetical protein